MSDDINDIIEKIGSFTKKHRHASMKRRRQEKKKKIVTESIKMHRDSSKFNNEVKFEDGSVKTWFDENPDIKLESTRNEFFLAGACLNDLYITKILDQRIKRGLNTHQEKENFVCSRKQWIKFIRENFKEEQWHIVEFGTTAGMIIHWKDLCFIDYQTNSTSVEVKLFGSLEEVANFHSLISNSFTVASCHVEWVYSGDGSSVDIPLLGEKLPVTEMYPFLNTETIEDYYDRFMDSSASILLLIGPPGTGKTTFIRGLLHHSSKNAVVTYDETLLQKDYVFARFIEDDVSVMVIEDADTFLRSRTDGNSMMHRFLNVGDGLITVKGKKLVFSTNLPSVNDVDPALIRPGRCFDIVSFRNYTKKEAKALAKKLNIDLKADKEEYSLAEIFHEQTYVKPTKTVGFI